MSSKEQFIWVNLYSLDLRYIKQNRNLDFYPEATVDNKCLGYLLGIYNFDVR